MVIHRNDHEHLIHGNREERLMLLIILIMLALTPIVILWSH
jgi:hypothetical protein